MAKQADQNQTNPPSQKVKEVLDKLDRLASKHYPPLSYRGVSLGLTDEGLRLATDTGIIEISTKSILEIASIRDDRPEVVSVTVSDTLGISEILRVEPLTGFSHDSLPGISSRYTSLAALVEALTNLNISKGWTYSGGDDCWDTVTRSGTAKDQDATDDYTCSRPYPDDEASSGYLGRF